MWSKEVVTAFMASFLLSINTVRIVNESSFYEDRFRGLVGCQKMVYTPTLVTASKLRIGVATINQNLY